MLIFYLLAWRTGNDMIRFKDFIKESTPNPVAKHAPKYNKAMVHKDKKKESKKGYAKHKGEKT